MRKARGINMVTILGVSGLIGSILAVIFGLMVMIFPKTLRVMIGLYLIIVGLLGIVGNFI